MACVAGAVGTWTATTFFATRWFTDDLLSKMWMASLMVGITVLCTRVKVRCAGVRGAVPSPSHAVRRTAMCQGGVNGPNMAFFACTCAVIRALLAAPYLLVAYYDKKYRRFALAEVANLGVEAALFVTTAIIEPVRWPFVLRVRVSGSAAVGCGEAHERWPACVPHRQGNGRYACLYIAAFWKQICALAWVACGLPSRRSSSFLLLTARAPTCVRRGVAVHRPQFSRWLSPHECSNSSSPHGLR